MGTKARSDAGASRGSKSSGAGRYAGARVRLLRVAEGAQAATVMIGPVRGPEHLDLIRRQAFYHVPVSAIGAGRAAVTHIAFYEPASRFGVPGAIRAYATVRGVSQVRRADLPHIPWPGRHGPDAPYYRFDLGPLLDLPQPILNPEHRRMVFRFADLARVEHAGTLAELGGTPRTRPRPRGRS
jgi:hypothetical protein